MAWRDHAKGSNGKGKGKGACPSTNAAERALLEGYRIGCAVSGSQTWSKGTTKGDGSASAWGKGAGGKHGGTATKHDRTCQREGCRAAAKKQATFGGGCNCFACGLSLQATLPVEQLVDWAYAERLDAKRTENLDKGTGATPAAKPAAPRAKALPPR